MRSPNIDLFCFFFRRTLAGLFFQTAGGRKCVQVDGVIRERDWPWVRGRVRGACGAKKTTEQQKHFASQRFFFLAGFV
jgi:hypothetical protein